MPIYDLFIRNIVICIISIAIVIGTLCSMSSSRSLAGPRFAIYTHISNKISTIHMKPHTHHFQLDRITFAISLDI